MQQPEYDPLVRFIKGLMDKFSQKNQGQKSRFPLLVIGAVVLYLLSSCIYTVNVDEVAVIQLFGKYVRQAGPGLQFKLPNGIEKKTKIMVKRVYTAEFGMRTLKTGVQTEYAPEGQFLDESLMLTGDLNCAVVPWIVQFRINDPVQFLFRVREPQLTLRDMSEAVMRSVIGDRSINEVITKRLEIADLAKGELQKALDEAQTGFVIVNIELKNTNVPPPVQPSFNEVNQALQEKEKMIYQAKQAYNKAIPSAKGEAERLIRESEGYALERINSARGDSSAFVQQYLAYSTNKQVTRRRLYLETLQDILPKIGKKYIVDEDQKNVLPIFNMNSLGVK